MSTGIMLITGEFISEFWNLHSAQIQEDAQSCFGLLIKAKGWELSTPAEYHSSQLPFGALACAFEYHLHNDH